MVSYRDNDDEDDDWDDDEAEFDEDSDDEPTVPCPYCRHEMLEDSPQCPSCKRFLSAEDHAASRQPAWVIITALACLAMAIWWALTGI
jgi:hypothetical protein